MKRLLAVLVGCMILLCSCSEKVNVMKEGDSFSVTGVVDYSDEPSDIGQEYCYITTNEKIEYSYEDIYGETSVWSSEIFYTKGDDTDILKEYIGKSITVSGIFDAEVHGIPYITSISVK